MSDFYTRMRDDVAIPLVTKYGAPITVQRTEDSGTWVREYSVLTKSYIWRNTVDDTTSPTAPGETAITYTGNGVLTEYAVEEIDGAIIQKNDVKVIAVEIPEPVVGDKLTILGVTYTVIDFKSVKPGGVEIVYKIQVRQ